MDRFGNGPACRGSCRPGGWRRAGRNGPSMNLQRGDVLKARFPHASGGRGKKRPVVVVQADVYNQRLRHAVVAQITSNLAEKGDPAFLFVKSGTPEGKATGLTQDCLVCCTLLN